MDNVLKKINYSEKSIKDMINLIRKDVTQDEDALDSYRYYLRLGIPFDKFIDPKYPPRLSKFLAERYLKGKDYFILFRDVPEKSISSLVDFLLTNENRLGEFNMDSVIGEYNDGLVHELNDVHRIYRNKGVPVIYLAKLKCDMKIIKFFCESYLNGKNYFEYIGPSFTKKDFDLLVKCIYFDFKPHLVKKIKEHGYRKLNFIYEFLARGLDINSILTVIDNEKRPTDLERLTLEAMLSNLDKDLKYFEVDNLNCDYDCDDSYLVAATDKEQAKLISVFVGKFGINSNLDIEEVNGKAAGILHTSMLRSW